MKTNQNPQGLLDYFKLRQLGRYPNELSEEIAPVVDITPFQSYGQTRRADFLSQFNGGGGSGVDISGGNYLFDEWAAFMEGPYVPETETWWIQKWNFSLTFANNSDASTAYFYPEPIYSHLGRAFMFPNGRNSTTALTAPGLVGNDRLLRAGTFMDVQVASGCDPFWIEGGSGIGFGSGGLIHVDSGDVLIMMLSVWYVPLQTG